MLFGLILAVATSGSAMATDLAGSDWRPSFISLADLPSGIQMIVHFNPDGRITGSGGCNQFFGGYTYAEGSISFTQVGMTMMACEDPIGTVEMAYTQALNGATTVTFDDGGQMLLSGTGGDVLFKADAEAAR